MYKRKKQAIEDELNISRRESYEETMKRLHKENQMIKDSVYWRHSASRHAQELERAQERAQQAELAGSMKAEAINNAPIDELTAEIAEETFNAELLEEIRVTLMSSINIIEEAIDDFISDETPIRPNSLLSIKEQLFWVMDAQEKLGK